MAGTNTRDNFPAAFRILFIDTGEFSFFQHRVSLPWERTGVGSEKWLKVPLDSGGIHLTERNREGVWRIAVGAGFPGSGGPVRRISLTWVASG